MLIQKGVQVNVGQPTKAHDPLKKANNYGLRSYNVNPLEDDASWSLAFPLDFGPKQRTSSIANDKEVARIEVPNSNTEGSHDEGIDNNNGEKPLHEVVETRCLGLEIGLYVDNEEEVLVALVEKNQKKIGLKEKKIHKAKKVVEEVIKQGKVSQ